MATHVWICPSCGRRVPLRVEACHCGMTRERAAALAAPTASPARPGGGVRIPAAPREPLPGDVKALLATLVVVTLFAAGWLLFRPWRPEPITPVLGWVVPAPTPPPKPTPAPSPPFKLPWWK